MRPVRVLAVAVAVGMALGVAGCGKKTDCHKLAEAVCADDGFGAGECAEAKRHARRAKTEAETTACAREYAAAFVEHHECHQVAELICGDTGISAEDCAKARREARRVKSAAEKAACAKLFEVFSKIEK